MIQKLFWILILVASSYTVGVFFAPTQTDVLAEKIGTTGYNNFVRSFKTTLDNVTTDIPTKDEFLEGGQAALSGAIDIKDTVVQGIGTTKDTIDTVRSTLSGAESTYNEAKDTFDKAKDFVEGASEKVQNVRNTLDDIEWLGQSITNTVNTQNVDAVIEDTQR